MGYFPWCKGVFHFKMACLGDHLKTDLIRSFSMKEAVAGSGIARRIKTICSFVGQKIMRPCQNNCCSSTSRILIKGKSLTLSPLNLFHEVLDKLPWQYSNMYSLRSSSIVSAGLPPLLPQRIFLVVNMFSSLSFLILITKNNSRLSVWVAYNVELSPVFSKQSYLSQFGCHW